MDPLLKLLKFKKGSDAIGGKGLSKGRSMAKIRTSSMPSPLSSRVSKGIQVKPKDVEEEEKEEVPHPSFTRRGFEAVKEKLTPAEISRRRRYIREMEQKRNKM